MKNNNAIKRGWPQILIISILSFSALLTFLLGLGMLFPKSALYDIWQLNPTAQKAFGTSRVIASTLLFILGLLSVLTAFGLYRSKRWAWFLSVSIFSIVFIFNFSRLIIGDRGEYFGTPFTGILLALHFLPGVRILHNRHGIK